MRGFLRTNGHADEAIDRYKEMLRVVPNDARTEVELATAYKTLGRYQEAIDAYAQAFQADPSIITSGDVSREYGMALILNGEAPKAEAVFTSLLSNQSTRESGLRSLALLDLYRGKYASARPLLEEALVYDEGLKIEPVSERASTCSWQFWRRARETHRGATRARFRDGEFQGDPAEGDSWRLDRL